MIGIIGALAGFLAAFLTFLAADRRIRAEHVTAHRKRWINSIIRKAPAFVACLSDNIDQSMKLQRAVELILLVNPSQADKLTIEQRKNITDLVYAALGRDSISDAELKSFVENTGVVLSKEWDTMLGEAASFALPNWLHFFRRVWFWALLVVSAAIISMVLWALQAEDRYHRKELCRQAAAALSFSNTALTREALDRARYVFDKADCEAVLIGLLNPVEPPR
jgi:hypothetical protein